MAKSYSLLCIYDFFIHPSVPRTFWLPRVSTAVNAATEHDCEHCFQSLSFCKTETAPMRHFSPHSPPPQPLAPTILLSVSMEPLPWRPSLSGLKHHFFFPVCLMSLSIKALRIYAHCSLYQNCLPFRLDNIQCVDGPWSVCPSVVGTHGISTFISHTF